MGKESIHGLPGSPAKDFPQRLQVRCQPGLGSHLKASLGKDSFPNSLLQLWEAFSSLRAVGPSVLVPCWLLAEGHSKFHPTWASPVWQHEQLARESLLARGKSQAFII